MSMLGDLLGKMGGSGRQSRGGRRRRTGKRRTGKRRHGRRTRSGPFSIFSGGGDGNRREASSM